MTISVFSLHINATYIIFCVAAAQFNCCSSCNRWNSLKPKKTCI